MPDPAISTKGFYIPPNVRDALLMLNSPEILDHGAQSYRAGLLRRRGLADDPTALRTLGFEKLLHAPLQSGV